MVKVKAIIFDLWGTTIENGVYPSPSKQAMYFLRVRSTFSDFIVKFEESFMRKEHASLKEGFEAVVNDFDLRIPDFVYDKLVGMWNKNAILSKEYPDTRKALEELRKQGYKLFLLTNIDKSSYDQLNEKFKLEELFDEVYPSFRIGLLKSNKESYEQLLKENKLKKQDVVMVGDSVESDIKSAEEAGVKAILVDRKDNREYEPKVKDLTELSEKIQSLS